MARMLDASAMISDRPPILFTKHSAASQLMAGCFLHIEVRK